MERTIAVFGASRSVPGDGHYEDAVECGRLLAEAGFIVATGGYGGLMEAVSRGASLSGGHVVGVTAPTVFPGRIGANDHVHREKRAESLVERIGVLVEESDGALALWGSLGTAAELLIAWNLAYVAPFADQKPKPVIAVGQPWLSIVPALEDELATSTGVVLVTASVREAVTELVRSFDSDRGPDPSRAT